MSVFRRHRPDGYHEHEAHEVHELEKTLREQRHEVDDEIALAQRRAELLAEMGASHRPPVDHHRDLPTGGAAEAVADVERLRGDDHPSAT